MMCRYGPPEKRITGDLHHEARGCYSGSFDQVLCLRSLSLRIWVSDTDKKMQYHIDMYIYIMFECQA